MKEKLPFQIMLAVTIAITAVAVGYNLFGREAFPVLVRYRFPQVESQSAQQPVPETADFAEAPDDTPYEPAPRWEDIVEENEPPAGDNPVMDWKDEPEAPHGEFWEEPDQEERVVQFPLNLNEAVYEDLIVIPGVGDVTAQRILQYRDHLGGYEELEQLMEISGIGEVKFGQIAPYLVVE